MAKHDDPAQKDACARLQASFRDRMRDTAQLLDGFAHVLRQGRLDEATRARLAEAAHGMAGAGTIFGFPEVSEAGLKLDSFLLNKGRDQEMLAHLIEKLRSLCASCAQEDRPLFAPLANEWRTDTKH